MNQTFYAAGALAAAIGITLALNASAASAKPMANAAGMEKCYGINAVAKNDCAAGAHSCAGQATRARDPKSFVLVPKGVCGKIDGGSTAPGM